MCAQAALHVRIEYSPVESDAGWGNGLGTGDMMGAVPHVYFPLRHGCRLTLYNDAHQVCTACRLSNPGCICRNADLSFEHNHSYVCMICRASVGVTSVELT